jgi:hypothetical protein
MKRVERWKNLFYEGSSDHHKGLFENYFDL